MSVIGGRGDLQHTTDRLDPVSPAIIVNEADHGLNRRSSSAWAKYAEALRRIQIGLAKLAVLAFQRLDPLAFVCRGASATALVPLSLGHPVVKGSAPYTRSSPQSRRSPPIARRDRLGARSPSARRARALQVKTLPLLLVHGSILSRVGASRANPGRFNGLHRSHFESFTTLTRSIWVTPLIGVVIGERR